MNEDDKLILEKNGWIIECESPLEIKNEETNDFASGVATELVLDSLKPKPKLKKRDMLLWTTN